MTFTRGGRLTVEAVWISVFVRFKTLLVDVKSVLVYVLSELAELVEVVEFEKLLDVVASALAAADDVLSRLAGQVEKVAFDANVEGAVSDVVSVDVLAVVNVVNGDSVEVEIGVKAEAEVVEVELELEP